MCYMAFGRVLVTETNDRMGGCRARSHCMYVQADVALPPLQNKPMYVTGSIRLTFKRFLYNCLTVVYIVYFQFQEGKQVDPEMYGIIQRSLKYLYTQLNQQSGQKIIRASYLEIYNEQVQY